MVAVALICEAEPLAMPSVDTSLEAVFRQHHDFVWGVARSLGASPELADDVVQDAFLVVQRRIKDYDATLKMRPWLAGITRRVLADHRKKRRRSKVREARADAPRLVTDPEPKLIADQRAKALAGFLDSLSDDQREVFVLVSIEGLSAREVSEATGIKANTVSSRLRLARKRFASFAQEWTQKEEREELAR